MNVSNPLAITSVTYHPYALDDVLRGIREAGYSRVELVSVLGHCDHLKFDMDDAGVAELLAQLDRYGLELACLGCHTGLATKEAIETFKGAINLAPKLGLDIVVNSIAGPTGHEEDLDGFFEHVGSALEYAQERGVTIALELHGNHTGNGRSMLNLIRRVDHPNLKINYDTANCVFHGGAWPYEDLELALPEVANLHLKDKVGGKGVWDFPPIGKGEIDFERVFQILNQGGYSGSISIEIEFDERGVPPLAEVNEAASLSLRNATRLLEASRS